MIILDASAVLEFLTGTDAGAIVAERIAGDAELGAPALLDVEVLSVLRRKVGARTLSSARASQMIEEFRFLPIIRQGHLPLLDRIWEMRDNFTTYDACYLALTEMLDATLLTKDKALGKARLKKGKIELI